MKKIFIYLSLFLGSVSMLHAQPQNPARSQEKIKALYVAYITQQLTLTESEAQKFWPVHSEYDAEITLANQKKTEIERQEHSLNVRKKFQYKFKDILGAERTDKFFTKDSEFRKRMVERLRKSKAKNR